MEDYVNPLIIGSHLSEKVEQVGLTGAANSFKFSIGEWHFEGAT